jgi:hypothetical protein
MKFLTKYQRKIALLLTMVMILQFITPNICYALTSGPSQPEMKGFEPIGSSDMVDLFSGDFSYNIPLMDVGGYPVNLAYHSGSGMDDEASWVGYGWGLNVGSVNRQLRGIPDDFNGTDLQKREMNMKDHITKGGRFSMTLDLLGVPMDRIKGKAKKKKLNLSLTVSVGVKVDNYRGIGMELGFNPGLSLSEYAAGPKTPKNDSVDLEGTKAIPVSGGLTLSSQDGASAEINAQMILDKVTHEDKSSSLTKSIGFGYNSRSGLTGMTLGTSFSAMTYHKFDDEGKLIRKDFEATSSSNSFISFNGDTYTPTIDHPTRIQSFTFSLHLGPELFVAFPGIGVSGFYSKQTISKKIRFSPAFGYMYSEKGKDNMEALMDLNREKDIPFSNQVKYLPIPIPTYDLFSANSQDGSGQYRLYRGSSGIFFDQKTENTSDDVTLGIEAGAGTYFDVGADLYFQDLKTKTQKWINRNNFLPKGDFQASSNDPLYEKAYFKRIGEPVPYDKDYVSKIKNTGPVAVSLPGKISNGILGAEAADKLRTKTSGDGEDISILKRDKREVRNTTFSYLTAKEAANHGLDKIIKDYNPDSLSFGNCNSGGIRNSFQRVGDYRKAHHLSEITITGDDGKRSVYGIPVYNTYQEEVSFSVPQNLALRKKGLIHYNNGADNSTNNGNGLENYYNKETTAPYSTSYLLTAILSPDYVDVTKNGVTDDDLGTAVKFNYSKLNSLYKWRTPYAFGPDTANYNEGFLSDALDDKANYVYGEKEVWYLHSIESKTMIAQFVTEDRDDGLGVASSEGAINTSVRLKRLKEIRLYSKSDLKLNGNNPLKTVPIKVVHFVYDYTICQGLPNSINHVGKLTLKRVFFTFGLNNKGSLNPYDFQYDASYNFYDYRQYDRWGNFKDATNNPNSLNNSEFPYTIQDSTLASQFASAWQLKKIILPSGGSISITYESDNYAYVQDRRASEMCMLNGVGAQGSGTNLVGADYIYINLPYPVSSDKELQDRYFEGITNLYYKFYLDLDAKGHKEFVPGYAELDPFVKPVLAPGTNNIAKIKLKKIKGINPIAKAGWQFIRTSLPKYAYPGSDNLEDNGSDLKKAIKALVTAFGTIKELFYGFEKRAKNKGFSNNVDLSKSWVRLCSPEWKKFGGGSRVKRIDISDDWAAMSGTTGAKTATYSQLYDYTTKNEKGITISSGVASYEPNIGSDENPFHQPIRYKANQFLALDNYYYIEEPFCESLFPAASVGYSKVTVKTIGTNDAESVNRTGTVVSEFFTAKDYPVKVDILGLQQRKPATDKIFKLISGISYNMVGLSQGYSIELNDMHGKPKSVNVFNKSGQNISSVEYFYKSVNELSEKKELRNDVKVIDETGTVSDGTIGMDTELYTDMRQQTTENLGGSVKVSGGSGALVFIPLPFFFPGIGVNYDKRSYRASSTIKIINRFAIQYKVKKMENGSTITSENLLWDSETGNVLLTKTQNEFDDPIYSFAYPAHWIYNGMGQAYQNLGTILDNFSTGTNGTINNSVYNSLLVPGDELININSANKYWVVNSPINNNYSKRIIDENGNVQVLNGITVKLIRSGRRNMANTAIATLSSLNNPIIGDRLDVTALTKILDAKATVFKEEWSMPLSSCGCPSGYSLSPDGNFCIKDTLPQVTSGCYIACQGSHDISYSFDGTYIFKSGYNADGTGQIDTSIIDPANRLWVGRSCSNGPLSPVNGNADSSSFGLQPNAPSGDASTPDTCIGNPNAAWNTNFCGPLHRCGIWSCKDSINSINRNPYNEWIGFSKCITITSSKTYYVGIAGDNYIRFLVDGALKVEIATCSSQEPFKKWRVYPINLQQGSHVIQLEGNNCGGPASFGAEIYDNTVQQLASAAGINNLNIIFSTRDMVGHQLDVGHYTCPGGYSLNTCDSPFTCRAFIPINKIVNPYYKGLLGNWRPESQFVYQVSRENISGDINVKGTTDIRKSGAYSVFNPFWKYNNTNLIWDQNPLNDAKWIAANEVTYFNSKGLEVENKDALNRYSSALFGYLESMPVAVASNSRYREIAYDGFEDYGFNLDCTTSDTCNKGHFNFRNLINGSTIDTTSLYAHSGKYSLKLNGNATITKTVYSGEITNLFSYDNSGQYLLQANELAKGFSPISGKKYVLSFWIKDANPRDPTTSVQATVNGTTLISNLSKWPIVEGWKRVETPFIFPSTATSFSLQLQSSGIVYFDDIRIHPFDGQMKSFAYDPSSQRLMAELDENNFATFYEYDDEGILVRVKKETERGIMTIKETRSSYRKRQ